MYVYVYIYTYICLCQPSTGTFSGTISEQFVHRAAPVNAVYLPASQSVQVAVPVNALYFPATHAAHGPPFGPVDPVLQVQLVKAALPAGELELDGQALHVELAPTAVEYVPAPQSVHRAAPVNAVYLPASQSVQVAVPINALYFPATHAAHGPPFGPVHPVLQVQFVKAALPAGELEFDGQALHVELVEDPTAVEYVPAPQSVHRAAPVNDLYLPATHAVHMTPGDEVDPLLHEATKPE